jgi:ATP-dependent DNA helicase DinG
VKDRGQSSLIGVPDPAIDAALARATGTLPGHEERPAQRAMAEAVAAAVRENRHLIVQAGTGTGKSLAYLVPALALGTRAVVSTATKALQDQLATRDLPALAESLALPFEFAVLKGRSNYLCRQRVTEVSGGDQQMVLDPGSTGPEPGAALGPLGREVHRLVQWADSAATGDRADLSWEPSDAAWAQVSVSARDCPGAGRCPSGSRCFAEAAREKALASDVVVVNTHLYTTALAVGAEMLPPHDLVVFDEAHELEDIASSAFGFEIGAGRLQALARSIRPLLTDPSAAVEVDEAALLINETLRSHHGSALPHPLDDSTQERLVLTRERVSRLMAEVRRAIRTGEAGQAEARLGEDRPGASPPSGTRGDVGRHLRAQQSATHLLRDLDYVIGISETDVAWVEGPEHAPLLRVAPLDVGAAFRDRLWSREDAPTAVLTSATIPPRLGERLGLAGGSYDQLDVGSPFAYDEQSLLYCPLQLPDPRDPGFEKAMQDELVMLIEAAEGRTLALFTSWRAMRASAEAVRHRVRWPILLQSDLPKPALIARFAADEHTCLFATMGFWQGVDVRGSTLSLVTIDRLPFARPDDPLLQARRAQLGRSAFEMIDVPRAATLLAQGTGRLIRARSDRGVVAVFDTRLAKARYRWSLINALPPMRRTRHRSEVEAFLQSIAFSSRAAPEPSDGSASSGRP